MESNVFCKFYILFFVLLALVFTQCKSVKTVENSSRSAAQVISNNKCSTEALVKDFGGRDSCGILFFMTGQKKITAPGFSPKDFKLKDGQKVSIDFKLKEGETSSCIWKPLVAKITCIQLLNETLVSDSTSNDCNTLIDPMRMPWMVSEIRENNPYAIARGHMNGKTYWKFISVHRNKYFECDGKLVCASSNREYGDCGKLMDGVKDFNVIWTRNN